MVRLVPDQASIDQKSVRMVLGKLAVLTAAELADAIEIPEARARVLPAGVAIVAAVASLVQPERIEVVHSGIRAGLLAAVFEDWSGRVEPDSALQEGRPVESGADLAVDVASPTGNGDFRATMSALIAARWAEVMEAIPAAIAGERDGVHDVRVASRRLRAAMDVAAPIFPSKWFKPLHRVARDITGALGDVRDRDVLLEALRAERAAAPLAEHPGIDRLMHRIERERAQAQVEAESYLRELWSPEFIASVERRFGQMPEHRLDGAGTEAKSW